MIKSLQLLPPGLVDPKDGESEQRQDGELCPSAQYALIAYDCCCYILISRSITCRKRHLKCDESKPVCQQCERSKRSCDYSTASRRPKPMERSASPSELTSSVDAHQDGLNGESDHPSGTPAGQTRQASAEPQSQDTGEPQMVAYCMWERLPRSTRD